MSGNAAEASALSGHNLAIKRQGEDIEYNDDLPTYAISPTTFGWVGLDGRDSSEFPIDPQDGCRLCRLHARPLRPSGPSITTRTLASAGKLGFRVQDVRGAL